MTAKPEWLRSLKVGDEVAVYHSMVGGGWYEFLKVAKRTATQIVVGASRYRVGDGFRTGDNYGSSLHEPTAELKSVEGEKAMQRTLASKLNAVSWRHVPLATLREIDAILSRKD